MVSIPDYPFSAVVGQALFKKALTLVAVNPKIGGVLISGPRGSAKSTLARGFASVLSDGDKTFVTLPLGATEEMLVGTLDLQQVLDDQTVAFNPGLLSKAHGGVLYVDEVNLLPDTLVDLLLDVSASGVNHVERDGISHKHSAEFLLIGTMNPDEGELRPQLQDRFGLSVELDNRYALEERIEIVKRREAFDAAPDDFCNAFAANQQELIASISAARNLLPSVQCPTALRASIAERCVEANVEGLRADIVWFRAAQAHAAWSHRREVTEDDVNVVEPLVLAHRRQPSNQTQPPSKPPASTSYSRPPSSPSPEHQQQGLPKDNESLGEWGSMAPQQQSAADIDSLSLEWPVAQKAQADSVRRQAGKKKGPSYGGVKYVGKRSSQLDWFATLLSNTACWPPETLRFRQARTGLSVMNLVLLDTSASTLAGRLFAQAKAVVLQIAERAYFDREQLAILGFGNDKVEAVLQPARAPKVLQGLLENVSAGGGTPIRDALLQAQHWLQQLKRQMPEFTFCTWLLTDGRTRQSVSDIALPGECKVIDLEQSTVKRGRARELARELGAGYLALS